VDGKAKLVAEVYCDGLGACLGECPTGALEVVEREADEFDEHAVEEHLKSMAEEDVQHVIPLTSGCPSSQIKMFGEAKPAARSGEAAEEGGVDSALTHWPVQVRLVSPSAPFLKGAHLLVVADCGPVAYPNFHRDFLKGKVVMVIRRVDTVAA